MGKIMSTIKKQRGFTIIEVALVLAVAALIFLVVFLAVPALQRNQRDDARKRDVSNVVAAVTAINANNGTVSATTIKTYQSGGFSNVLDKTTPIVLKTAPAANATASAAPDDQIFVFPKAKCVSASSGNVDIGSARQYAVIIKLEGGGGSVYSCMGA